MAQEMIEKLNSLTQEAGQGRETPTKQCLERAIALFEGVGPPDQGRHLRKLKEDLDFLSLISFRILGRHAGHRTDESEEPPRKKTRKNSRKPKKDKAFSKKDTDIPTELADYPRQVRVICGLFVESHNYYVNSTRELGSSGPYAMLLCLFA